METLHIALEQLPIDRSSIPQEMLDLDLRERTNLFPWRGQFSPCLVELLLSAYSKPGDCIFDPFAGVGTTLFEAARKQLPSCGTEINPAALIMANTVRFLELNQKQRIARIQSARSLLESNLGLGLPLFDQSAINIKTRIIELINDVPSPADRSLLENTFLRAMKSAPDLSLSDVYQAFTQHAEIVTKLPFTTQECRISQADARQSGLTDKSIDLIITSPPYINVFNYHQNHRPAMELLGRDVMTVAKSEFGSNRKNRGNRFLTVVQYCLDLKASLTELSRVLKNSGRAIFVVGRKSNVRGIPFQNGSLVASLAEMSGFRVDLRQERKFRNIFGESIYEDIIHLVPTANHNVMSDARAVAISALRANLERHFDFDVKKDLKVAIDNAQRVNESPLFIPREIQRGKPQVVSDPSFSYVGGLRSVEAAP